MDIIYSIVPLAIGNIVPLLIIAMGGLFSERSGVVNIGLEGLLGIGAFACALVTYYLFPIIGVSGVWVGILAGTLAGGIFSLLHAFACINMQSNQVVSGTAINILSAAITVYIARVLTGSANVQIVRGIGKTDVPMLSKIPVIGDLFFMNAYTTTFIIVLIVFLSWFFLYRRPGGLRLRACGENPHAADSMGISVLKMRYLGVIMSGLYAGLGGAIIIVTISGEFSPLTYNGTGFLALAALIFGKWQPWKVLGAASFFGLAKTVASISRIYPAISDMPNIIFNTFPYIATIIALILFSKNTVGPRAAGEPFDVSKR